MCQVEKMRMLGAGRAESRTSKRVRKVFSAVRTLLANYAAVAV